MQPVDTGYARPRDPVELWLARQWQQVLGFGVGITENFFGIGGNSLDAARIINAVLEEFGVQLPLNVMTESPTVEGLAARLRDHNERLSGPLVEIQHGDGTPLFLIHPDDGQIGSFCHLVQALGEELPVFGLQAAGLYTDTEPARTVPAMAGTYLDAIRAVQPTGPYLLGGCGIGAAIAYELSTRLDPAEVRLLAAIDPDLVQPQRTEPEIPQLPGEKPEFAERALRVWKANRKAVVGWEPRQYSGTLDVFVSRQPAVDWPATEVRVHECADGRRLAHLLRERIG
ncbi:MAG: thioesterase domain-containing protein [Labedaea sp.]